MLWWRVKDIVLLDRGGVDSKARADDSSHRSRGEEGGARWRGDQGSSVTRRRVAAGTRHARRSHREVAIRPDTVRAGRWQKVEAVNHGSAGHGVVGARSAKAGSQWHARVAVEGERVERAVSEETVGDRLLVLVAVVAARSRRHSRGMTSSLGGCLRSCASGATRTSSIATKLATSSDTKPKRSGNREKGKRVRNQGLRFSF